jgi:hypothetical protein
MLLLSLVTLPAASASAEPDWNGGYHEMVDFVGGV